MKYLTSIPSLFAFAAVVLLLPLTTTTASAQGCTSPIEILDGPSATPYFATANEIGNPPYGVFEVCETGLFTLELEPFFLSGVPDLAIECFNENRQWTDVGVFSSARDDNATIIMSSGPHEVCGIFNAEVLLDDVTAGGGPPIDSTSIAVSFQNPFSETETIENTRSLTELNAAEILFLNYEPAVTDSGVQPSILVFDAAAFAENSRYQTEYVLLESLIASNLDLTTIEPLPHLPTRSMSQLIQAQPVLLQGVGHEGVRYLTAYSPTEDRLSESAIYYTYQGLTADGAYYISATFPLIITDLPRPQILRFGGRSFDNYLDRIERSLIADEDGAVITPAVALLDELVQSIEIQ